MPFVKPMLAKTFRGALPDRFFLQRKLDGVRAIAAADGIWSRSGRRITSCPHIERELTTFFDIYPHLILDGELYHHQLCDDLFSIISAVNRRDPKPQTNDPLIQFHVYDIPSSQESFSCRAAILGKMLPRFSGERSAIQFVNTIAASHRAELDRYLAVSLADGFEGVIIRADAPYVHGRSSKLLKYKPFDDNEFDIVALDGPRGQHLARRATLRLADGRTFKAGIKCTRACAANLLNGDFRSATVRHFGLTPNGIPRSPVAVAFHESLSSRF